MSVAMIGRAMIAAAMMKTDMISRDLIETGMTEAVFIVRHIWIGMVEMRTDLIKNGYDQDGFNSDGYDRDGYDRQGLSKDTVKLIAITFVGRNLYRLNHRLSSWDKKLLLLFLKYFRIFHRITPNHLASKRSI